MRNETLITVRKQLGKTQSQVAKEAGISEIGYRTHEYGTRTPNVFTANRIARILGTTSEHLWGFGSSNAK